jgi:N-acetylneuraminic acid mutarotase
MGSAWETTTPLPYSVADHTAASYGNYIYVLGGTTPADPETSTVVFAEVSADGSISSWVNTTPLPNPHWEILAAAHNGYIYTTGGGQDTGDLQTTTVRFAPINATGSLGSWMDTTPLPRPSIEHRMLAYNNYLYVFGGNPDFETATTTVRFAPINATGSIGSWTDTSPLPGRVHGMGIARSGNYMYVIGGADNSDADTSTVAFATINATGSLSTWTVLPSLPHDAVGDLMAESDGEFLYVPGGSPGGETSTVVVASVEPSGNISTWIEVPPLDTAVQEYASAVVNGYLYVLGGDSASPQISTVQFIPLVTRNTYWGVEIPSSTPIGSYQSTVTYTAVFSP